MSEHSADIRWSRAPHPQDAHAYSRNHETRFPGGQRLQVSASVEFKGDPACVDPEQMVVSAVGSCHMLFFLAIAEQQGYLVESYRDQPVGTLGKSDRGGMEITRVVLSPAVSFGGDRLPDAAAIERMHAAAHRNCFIGKSLRAEVVVQPEYALA